MRTSLPKLAGGLAVALLCTAAPLAAPAAAQGFYDQAALEEILGRRAESLNGLPEVYYNYHVLQDDRRQNTVIARTNLYHAIGDGDVRLGKRRAELVWLLNRTILPEVALGDTLVVPDQFDLDIRAYSPFPRYWPGARQFDKLFLIEKGVQAWAAYEYGQLVRWGIVNTGSAESPTPTGRYNFNWKEEYRVSSLSPPGEPWEMYWVFNFHDPRGIHIHQYEMPTGGPTSHGCVRLVDADAEWIYHWADAWETTLGDGFGSNRGRLLEPGTTVLVLGEDPAGLPRPFTFKKRYPDPEADRPPRPPLRRPRRHGAAGALRRAARLALGRSIDEVRVPIRCCPGGCDLLHPA